MTYDKITVGKSVNPLTEEHWYKASATVTIEPGDDPQSVFEQVKSEIDRWLSAPQGVSITTTVVTTASNHSQYLLDVIKLSTSLRGLERFRAQVEKENNPSLTEAFEKRSAELS